MARSWAELLGDAEGPEETAEQQQGFFGRLRDSLGKSRRALTGELAAATFDPGNDEDWERLEEALIQGDVGVRATAELVRRLEARNDLTDLNGALAEEIAEMLGEPGTLNLPGQPQRHPRRRRQRHRQDDDDRQAGAEAARARTAPSCSARPTPGARPPRSSSRSGPSAREADFVGAAQGADPAAVAYDAVEAARARGKDVAIVDTAGRLHTQSNLMEELAKVRRVIESRLEGAPHETLLVVDATTGQNGLQQARLFGETVGVTGVALTKLDGSAKGGIAVAIAYELGLPVKLIGVGEGLDDLRPFDPHDFARALVSA